MGEDVDKLWLILGTVLVIFMHSGFTLLEVGSVSSKNTNNILAKNLMMPCIGALCWFCFGYGFAFGDDDGSGFIGKNDFGTGHNWFGHAQRVWPEEGNAPDPASDDAWWTFQCSFCATAATIVSGAVAERLQITAYFCYTVVLTTLVYPVVAHWAWGPDGWAQSMEISGSTHAVQDFAGSGVVHMVGGMAALTGIIVLGPRTGRFGADGKPVSAGFNGQSSVFCVLGTIILWVGWYGFNCVSTGAIDGNGNTAGHVAKTTTLAAALGGFTTFVLRRVLSGTWDITAGTNGILSGLVAITAGCAVVEDYGAICIGIVSAFVYLGSSNLLLRLQLDDVVDAIPVHLFNGFWGVVAVGFFSSADQMCGVFYRSQNYLNATTGLETDIPYRSCQGNQGTFLATQICFALAVVAWVGVLTFILFFALSKCGLLRLSAAEEQQGLDELEHGGSAYETDRDRLTRSGSFKIVQQNNLEKRLEYAS